MGPKGEKGNPGPPGYAPKVGAYLFLFISHFKTCIFIIFCAPLFFNLIHFHINMISHDF